MTDIASILVVILSVVLVIFLIVVIILVALLIKVIRRISDVADDAKEATRGIGVAVENIASFTSPVFFSSLLKGVANKFSNRSKRK